MKRKLVIRMRWSAANAAPASTHASDQPLGREVSVASVASAGWMSAAKSTKALAQSTASEEYRAVNSSPNWALATRLIHPTEL